LDRLLLVRLKKMAGSSTCADPQVRFSFPLAKKPSAATVRHPDESPRLLEPESANLKLTRPDPRCDRRCGRKKVAMCNRKVITVVGATGAQGGGLVRAILNDPNRTFAARVLTRDVNSAKAKGFARLGAEVVSADIDNSESLKRAFEGAYAA